jgi:hypothetical protein
LTCKDRSKDSGDGGGEFITVDASESMLGEGEEI